jgi:hypothetical protein
VRDDYHRLRLRAESALELDPPTKRVNADGKIEACWIMFDRENFGDANLWDEAERFLTHIAIHDGPTDGSYLKYDFVVVYTDGEIYEGRFDVVHPCTGKSRTLQQHIRDFLRFGAGLYQPSHLSDKDYQYWLKTDYVQKHIPEYRRWLDTYAIG